MARAVNSDFLHSMRFHVIVDSSSGPSRLNYSLVDGSPPEAGFSACTTPEASTEAVEYREGTFVYTRKYPGLPTMSDITLSRGVALPDSTFWAWMKTCIEGDGGYREDLTIKHFHRDPALSGPANQGTNNPFLKLDGAASTYRAYHIYEAFPIRHKVAADLDATASEISIMELDLSYERFEVEPF